MVFFSKQVKFVLDAQKTALAKQYLAGIQKVQKNQKRQFGLSPF